MSKKQPISIVFLGKTFTPAGKASGGLIAAKVDGRVLLTDPSMKAWIVDTKTGRYQSVGFSTVDVDGIGELVLNEQDPGFLVEWG